MILMYSIYMHIILPHVTRVDLPRGSLFQKVVIVQ